MKLRGHFHLLATLAIAGCLGTPAAVLDAHDAAPADARLDGLVDAVAWSGTVGVRQGECTPSTCAEHVFEVAAAAGEARVLTVAAKWPHEGAQLGLDGSDPSFQLDLAGPGGAALGEGRMGWLATVLVVEDPKPGSYTLRVWGTRTGGDYEVGAALSPAPERPSPPVDLLPDLVTMPLSELAVEHPHGPPFNTLVGPVWSAGAGALGVRGCGADEWVEERVERCLRFSNGVANLGAGAVEVRLRLRDAVANAAGAPQFLQRIYASDGGHRDAPAGPAEFHAIHGHYHFAAFAQTTLFAYDLDADRRGAQVVAGEKLGYCFIDIGVYAVDHAPLAEPRYVVDGCLVPAHEQALVSGLQPGWFDLYWSDLSHQYIDITGVPDGVYELESIANVEGRIREADLSNNGASVIFRLTGDAVEVLGHRPAA
ncbi:MAG TPA: lysyl oxidase family protein [Candidatus Thermoplasmatota archaeon]|nr:lysyl oxidase family protein [Candidatus Thermoplasmatota archaeon]